MRLCSSFRIIRVTLAFAVALWMAGAGCLLGCEKSVASAASEVDEHARPSALIASGEVCAAHGAKAKRAVNSNTKHNVQSANSNFSLTSRNARVSIGKAQPSAVAGNSSSMMNCPLAVNATAALSKSGLESVDSGLAVDKPAAPLLNSLEPVTPFARPPRVPNRGDTYLRCCVFLI